LNGWKEKNDPILTMGRRSRQALALLHGLFGLTVITIKNAAQITGLSLKAANDLVKIFVEKGILVETTGYLRNRTFLFKEYMNMF